MPAWFSVCKWTIYGSGACVCVCLSARQEQNNVRVSNNNKKNNVNSREAYKARAESHEPISSPFNVQLNSGFESDAHIAGNSTAHRVRATQAVERVAYASNNNKRVNGCVHANERMVWNDGMESI